MAAAMKNPFHQTHDGRGSYPDSPLIFQSTLPDLAPFRILDFGLVDSTGPDADNELDDSQVVNCGSDDSQIAMQQSKKRPVGSPAANNNNTATNPF